MGYGGRVAKVTNQKGSGIAQANGRDVVAQFRGELLQDIYNYMYRSVEDNFDKYIAASQLFADGASQALFYKLMLYRCLGHIHLRVREDFTAKTLDEMYVRAASYETGPSPIEFNGLFGPIRHDENVPTDGPPVALDA